MMTKAGAAGLTLLVGITVVDLPARGGGPPATQRSDPDPLEPLERSALYHPRPYRWDEIAAFLSRGGTRINYRTGQGQQTAWLMWPTKPAPPPRLWVVCGGNGARAIDMEPVRRLIDRPNDAFVLIDYPGYGACQGLPGPASVRENVVRSVREAAKRVGLDVDRDPGAVIAFGHSLGCAAALMAVHEFHLRSAVLCAPFTSTREMSEWRFGIPAKGAPFAQQFDNRPPLAEMNANGGRAFLFHGSADEVVPLQMSKTLAAEDADAVRLTVVDGAGHNDLLSKARKQLAATAAALCVQPF
jgi:pimeloyl-ACP methyl ester carboxylesterase